MQTRLPACLFGAFCPFRLGGRQPACVSKTKNPSKPHRWQVPCSFAGTEMRPDKKRPAENTCRIVKGLDAVWAYFCPSKPYLPLSINGNYYTENLSVWQVLWQHLPRNFTLFLPACGCTRPGRRQIHPHPGRCGSAGSAYYRSTGCASPPGACPASPVP